MHQMIYPSLSRRYFATALDVFLLIALLISSVKMLDHLMVPTSSLYWYLIVLPVFLYEPILTSKGVTLGQWLFRFRIRDVISGEKISLVQAYGRWIIKFVLGGISLLTIPNDEHKRAIHDKLLASVAVSVTVSVTVSAAVSVEY
ncbi:RDD family protein [Marinicella rhabdoformis]|uniref:RDD family protein n=1 Tax=Marinicella rhabdoformis TaxID=2580566 RepID=UPI0012AEB90B|nr:RDD family protein [Marinicella rhabdoformis]